MPRIGLTPDRVVDAAMEVVAERGVVGLSLGGVAKRLGVKAPSLYNHVGGVDDLRRRVGIAGVEQLADVLGASVMGRSGEDAIRQLAAAYRAFAVGRPGIYLMTQEAHADDDEYAVAAQRAIAPVVAVQAGYGILGDDAIHATRAVRSALHGFVMLEINGGFGIELDVDESFERLVALLASALTRRGAGRAAEPG